MSRVFYAIVGSIWTPIVLSAYVLGFITAVLISR